MSHITDITILAGQRGLRECARLEWRRGDPGDPADVLHAFLSDSGFAVSALDRPSVMVSPPGLIAIIHLSAAVSAQLAGGEIGSGSPCPSIPDVVCVVGEPISVTLSNSAVAPCEIGPWVPSWSEKNHEKAVASVRAAIAEGDVYQVNVVGHASAPYAGDVGPSLQRVAALPGARYPIVVSGSGWALACASPETLVSVRDGRVETRPIKGTRPATERGRRELLASDKERAEHIMIVDLARNDLARVSATGTVRVDELFAVRRWSRLWQAESVVSGRLRAGTGLSDVLRALCPGGSVTGAPKLAALDEMASVEPVGRGPSMGALGVLSSDGLDLGLTIRTVAAAEGRLHLWAGGGITWGSDPVAEVAEAAAKAAPIRAALAA